jgi:hypothetical protein
MANQHHWTDPVAYRIEPLISKKMATNKPVQLQYNKGGLKGTIVGIADLGSDIVDRGRNIFSGIFSATSAVVGMAGFGAATPATTATAATAKSIASTGTQGSLDGGHPSTVTSGSVPSLAGSGSIASPSTSPTRGNYLAETPALRPKFSAETLSDSSAPAPTIGDGEVVDENDIRWLNPRGRIDYALQEGVLENPYLSSLSSHMTYWPDTDVAVFILRELYEPGLLERTGMAK